MNNLKQAIEDVKTQRAIPTVSATFDEGAMLEMVYRPSDRKTSFVIWDGENWKAEPKFSTATGQLLVPFSPNNNLLKNDVVLFPSEPEEYGSESLLVAEIQDFIHRYVDLSPLFEKLASYYVLLTWIYDGFNELPYLRVRGDPGSGKTRFLLTVGSLCYKPIFASGASTVSPLFRILDAVRGTLIIDESDFRMSDERAEVVKILNNGNAKGFPVLRSEATGSGREFNPRAYAVFGPKLVATRGFFDDRALESRFITEEMGQGQLRRDVPINLPASHKDQARELRNKLLLFRFRNLRKRQPSEALVDHSIEPRLNQVFVPLLTIIDDAEARRELRDVARQYNSEILADRGMDIEAQVLEIIQVMTSAPHHTELSIKTITSRFIELHEADYDRKITTKWIGTVIRRRLNLKAQKRHGVFVIPLAEKPKLERLYEKYGLASGQHPGASE